MNTVISFLSGKGGSGKTTMALSVADMVSKCGIKTVLIDFDFNTNGATYFYESRIAKKKRAKKEKNVPIGEWLYYGENYTFMTINVSDYLDFLPSIIDVSDPIYGKSILPNKEILDNKIKSLIDVLIQRYEIIIFDCAAGYYELLDSLLPLMDVDIFVMEADSISASAMRYLHLKTGSSLGKARLYQVFNKATPEEYEIYSKIVGTFFTNIGTILFDWKIRQAFSRSQIPEIKSVSPQYGVSLCEICNIIFQDQSIKNRLKTISQQLQLAQKKEERDKIELELYNMSIISKKNRKRKIIDIINTSGMFAVSFSMIVLLLYNSNIDSVEYKELFIVLVGALIAGIFFPFVFFFRNGRENIAALNLNRQKLDKLNREIAEAEKKASGKE